MVMDGRRSIVAVVFQPGIESNDDHASEKTGISRLIADSWCLRRQKNGRRHDATPLAAGVRATWT